ncbi:MAG: tetratricopeptide repeat protein [Myxococcota bacterium]|jgi:tetratricopeptide (TPR) repeat protein|nr:tetratricopeptide repeat protein [Myxococcota bacterium]
MGWKLESRMDDVSDLGHWLTVGRRAEDENMALEALRAYRRVLTFDGRHLEALLGLARVCLLLGEFERALEYLTLVLVQRRDMAEAYRLRGIAMVNLELVESGLDAFDRAIELAPENAEMWFSRGTSLLELGVLGRAEADLQRAHGLASADAEIALRLLEARLCSRAGLEAGDEALLEVARGCEEDPLFALLEAELLWRLRGEERDFLSIGRLASSPNLSLPLEGSDEAELEELLERLHSARLLPPATRRNAITR